ncbi:MAG: hypothetical protein LBB72_09115 [Spirochaetaceae bacterium]|nr:hypothetical protein [Spirochaetaceae bacterium]
MNIKHFLRVLPIFAVLMACSGRISGQLVQDGSGSLQIQAGLEPNMIALVRNLRDASGGQGGSVLDAATLNRTLQAAPGIASSALRNSGQEKIDGSVRISNIGDLLNTGAARFVSYTASSGAVPGKLTIHLDRSNAPLVLKQLGPEAEYYLALLLAPAATGDVISKAEYLEQVELVYSMIKGVDGKALAAEIAASGISVTITLPGTVKSVKGGTYSGREARFNIPLTDILVLEKALDYEITWGTAD